MTISWYVCQREGLYIYLLLWSLHKQCCWVRRTLWSHWIDTLSPAREMWLGMRQNFGKRLGSHPFHWSEASSSSLYPHPATSGLLWSQCVQSRWPKTQPMELLNWRKRFYSPQNVKVCTLTYTHITFLTVSGAGRREHTQFYVCSNVQSGFYHGPCCEWFHLTGDCSVVNAAAFDTCKHSDETETVFSPTAEIWDCVRHEFIFHQCSDVDLSSTEPKCIREDVFHFFPLQSDTGLILSHWFNLLCISRNWEKERHEEENDRISLTKCCVLLCLYSCFHR